MSTHPGNEWKIGVFVIGCVIQLSVSNQLLAQRQIPFDNMQFKPCSPHYVQLVLNAPPVTSDMPYDVIRSYVVIDSLAKSRFHARKCIGRSVIVCPYRKLRRC